MSFSGLMLRFSGGASNTNPQVCFGGVMSTATLAVFSPQTATRDASPIGGVTILHARSNALGVGTLSWDPSVTRLSWTPNGGTASATYVPSDGIYRVGYGSGRLLVSVTVASLPGSLTNESVTISSRAQNIFDHVPASERATGKTEYRCLWIRNYGNLDAINVTLQVQTDAAHSDITIGSEYITSGPTGTSYMDADYMRTHAVVDIQGSFHFATANPEDTRFFYHGRWNKGSVIGGSSGQTSDGATGQLPVTIVDEIDSTSQLSGVEWDTSLTWPIIEVGNAVSFWMKRVVPSDAGTPAYSEQAKLKLAYTGDW